MRALSLRRGPKPPSNSKFINGSRVEGVQICNLSDALLQFRHWFGSISSPARSAIARRVGLRTGVFSAFAVAFVGIPRRMRTLDVLQPRCVERNADNPF
jgi:hypothetical protein